MLEYVFLCADRTSHRDISLIVPVRYPIVHSFVTEMYARVHISVNSSPPSAAYGQCVSESVSIGSDNDLSPIRRQAII